MNWGLFLTKLPAVVAGIMGIVKHFKGASGMDKKAAVLASLPESVALAEFVAERDLLNDAVIAELVSAFIDAEAAAMKARDALEAGILAKASTIDPPGTTTS